LRLTDLVGGRRSWRGRLSDVRLRTGQPSAHRSGDDAMRLAVTGVPVHGATEAAGGLPAAAVDADLDAVDGAPVRCGCCPREADRVATDMRRTDGRRARWPVRALGVARGRLPAVPGVLALVAGRDGERVAGT